MAKNPVDEFNIFECRLCADRPQFNGGGMGAHLVDAHGRAPRTSYKKRTEAHIDSSDWYQSDYSWLDGETVIAVQSVRQARRH